MRKVEIYTKDYCSYSTRAKRLLRAKGVAFTETDVTNDAVREAEMRQRSGAHTVPQIFIRGRGVGGFDDMAALDRAGALDSLLDGPDAGRAAAA